jgi:hypothetical protein
MNRTLVVVFLAMVTLPLAGTVAGIDGGDPEAENRELASFPHWDGTWKSIVGYPDAFSRWFEDHFAGRAHLVRWSGEIRLFGLGVSPAETVIAGRNGWLYYADDGGVDDYANETPLSDGEVRAWHQAIVRTNDWLRRRNIAYVFTIPPDKHVIYPEHIPAGVQRVRGESRMDQVFATLAQTMVNVVDLRPALERDKPQERIYYLTDTHWNDRGAFIAYQQIIDAVRRQAPAVPPAWTRDDLDPIERPIDGKDLAGMLGLKRVLHGLETASRRDLPRLLRDAARAVSVRALQPRRLPVAERFRRRRRPRRTPRRRHRGDRRPASLHVPPDAGSDPAIADY